MPAYIHHRMVSLAGRNTTFFPVSRRFMSRRLHKYSILGVRDRNLADVILRQIDRVLRLFSVESIYVTP